MHFFISQSELDLKNQEITITKDHPLFYHITKSLRAKVGEKIAFCIENESIFISEVTKTKDVLLCSILAQKETPKEDFKVDVYHGTIKYTKWQESIRNSICSGANSITPVNMTRSILNLDNSKVDRLQKIAYASAEIAQSSFVPVVHNPIFFEEFVSKIPNYDLVIVPYEVKKTKTLKSVEQKIVDAKNIALIVGPEGGIAQEEIEKLQNHQNIEIVTLGTRILLTQVAPTFLLAEIMYIKSN